MKINKWVALLLVIIVALIVVIVVFSEDEGKYIKEINLTELNNKISNKDSFILYVKQTNCEHCKSFSPIFVSALKDSKLSAYSLNMTNLSEDEQKTFDNMFTVEGTPTVLFITEGEEGFLKIEGEQSKDKIISVFKNTGFIK